MHRSFRRHLEVFRAALRGFRYRHGIGAPVMSEGLVLAKRLLFFWRPRPKTPFKTWKFRLKACRRCDIYNRIYRTCGDNSGLLEVRGTLYPNGCSCIVGVKASDPDADCTLASYGLPSNWAASRFSLDGLPTQTDAGESKK